MRCPVDRSLLTEHRHDGLVFAACPSCHGLWLRPAALRRAGLPDDLEPPYAGLPASRVERPGRERRCADCRVALRAETVEGVEIDRCPGCGGLWLDAGELPTVAAWYRRQATVGSAAGVPEGRGVAAGGQKARAQAGEVAVNGFAELAIQGAFEVVGEGAVWIGEAVVRFAGVCLEGLTDGL